MVDKSVIDTILGEAGGRTRAARYSDMLAIASVIANRASLANTTPLSIVSAKGQFGAYGKSLPKGTEEYRDLAQAAWDYVERAGPVHNATYYATSKATNNLPSGLKAETTTEGHEYFSDPNGRSFRTADGWAKPSIGATPAVFSPNLTPPTLPYADLALPKSVSTVPTPPPSRVSIPAYAPPVSAAPPASLVPAPIGPMPSTPPPSRTAPGEFYTGKGMREVGTYVSRGKENVDAKLADILNTAAMGFPYDVQTKSGYRPGDSRQHGKGRAIDVQLVDPRTNLALPDYQTPQSFRAYEQFAQRAREVQMDKYPEMKDSFRWGGYFGGKKGKYGAADLMHFDIGGTNKLGMAGGSWDTGLTAAQKENLPGAVSIGMASLPDASWPGGIPTPTPRPDNLTPDDRAARAVTRAALPDIPSRAMGARAASELQGYVPQAPGSITLPDMPPSLATPPTFGNPIAMPALPAAAPIPTARPDFASLPSTAPLPSARPDVHSLPATAPVPTSRPSYPALPSMAPVPTARPGLDNTQTRSLPSVATPPTGLSISLPSAVPPTSVQTSKAGLIADFPDPPPAPGRQAAIDVAKGAAKGIMAGGLPGAVLGGILGPAMAQIGRNRASNALGVGSRISPFNGVLGAYKNIFGRMSLPSFGSIFGGMTPNYGAAQYGIGSGYGAIGSAFGAPAGATAYSRSNPEVTFTSLGNGMVSRSNSKTGVTYTMSADDYDPGSAGRSGGSSGKGSSGKGTGGLY